MVLLKYIGDIRPTRVKAKGNVYYIKEKGDMVDVAEDVVDMMMLSGDFELGGSKPAKKEKKKEVKVDDVSDNLEVEEVVDDDF